MVPILIKVASYGLKQVDVGKTLLQMQDKLTKLSEGFGIHCCGEGGEFESLVLDCDLFKKRIEM